MEFINGVTLLLLYELLGELVVLLLPVPIPGPVVGMVLLFFTLLVRRKPTAELEIAGDTLLSHLSLLFVPAGVGLMVHFDRLAQEWVPICVVLLVSTALTLVVTAAVMEKATAILKEK